MHKGLLIKKAASDDIQQIENEDSFEIRWYVNSSSI